MTYSQDKIMSNKIKHAEIMAGLQKKFYSLQHACNDKKHWATLDIIRDLRADFNKLELITMEEIEERVE